MDVLTRVISYVDKVLKIVPESSFRDAQDANRLIEQIKTMHREESLKDDIRYLREIEGKIRSDEVDDAAYNPMTRALDEMWHFATTVLLDNGILDLKNWYTYADVKKYLEEARSPIHEQT